MQILQINVSAKSSAEEEFIQVSKKAPISKQMTDFRWNRILIKKNISVAGDNGNPKTSPGIFFLFPN